MKGKAKSHTEEEEMNRRKHRVVVDITLNEPCSQKRAKQIVSFGLENSISDHWNEEVTKFTCKEFSRVFTASYGSGWK